MSKANRNDFIVTNAEIEAAGYKDEFTPPIVTCKYCKKELLTEGLLMVPKFEPNAMAMQVLWKGSHQGIGKPSTIEPRRCTCVQARQFWQLYDKADAERQKHMDEDKQAADREAWLDMLSKKSEIAESFPNMSFSNYDDGHAHDTPKERLTDVQKAYLKCRWYADNYKTIIADETSKHHGMGLYLAGGVGAGKTHLAVSILAQLTDEGIDTLAIRASDLLTRLRQSYNSNDKMQEQILLGLFTSVQVLLIDDLGKSKPTDWSLEQFYSIIDKRISRRKPIIVTVNYDDAELTERLTPKHGDAKTAEAIVSRLRQACSMTNAGAVDQRMRRKLPNAAER